MKNKIQKAREDLIPTIDEMLKNYDKALFLNLMGAIKKTHDDTMKELKDVVKRKAKV